MGFEKVVSATVWGVTTQNSDVRLPVGDSSGGIFTGRPNPLKGTLLWDQAIYVLNNVSVAGGATGGSYTVTIETDAIVGYTGLPIARTTLGPNSSTVTIMDNLHQSPASPLPTHLFIDQTAAGGAVTLTCDVIAKQYRGTLGTPGANTSERILQGTMLRGNSTSGQFGDDRGMTETQTFIFGTTGSNLGMHRMRLWDHALFWAVLGNSVSGTHDVRVFANINGEDTAIADTGTGTLNVAGEKVALFNSFYGQCPNLTKLTWTVRSAGGVSDAQVVGILKSGRGSLAKR